MSTDANGRIVGRTTTGLSNVTGVTILDAPNSSVGAGTLAYTASGTTATWAGFGSTSGSAVNIGSTGRYVLVDAAGGRLHISVTAGSLPVGNQTDTITVAAKANALFDDVTEVEALSGDTEYRCFYAYNAHATDDFTDVAIYIDSNASGDDTLQIGLDLSGIGDGSTAGVADTIANENTAPSPAVSFSTANGTANKIVIGTLNAGECQAIWQQRIVPADTNTAATDDVSVLVISAYYA
jgi:hypothetical protein